VRVTWHIFKKDFRSARWLLLAWILFAVIDAVSRVVTPRLSLSGEISGAAAGMWMALLWLVNWLFLLAFVAHHIQAEPLVGTTAFWLTRPVPRMALFQSKLAGLLLFIILPGLAAEAGLLTVFHVPIATTAEALLELTLSSVLLILVLAFAASITSSTIRLLQLVVGTLIGSFVLLMTIALLAPTDITPIQPAGIPFDPTPEVILIIALVIGFAIALWYHYAFRRRAFAMLAFIAALVVAMLVSAYWPPVSMFGGEPKLTEAWAHDPATSSARLRSRQRTYGQSYARGTSSPSPERMMKYIAAPIAIDNLPATYTAVPFTHDATLRFDDGRIVRSERSYHQTVRVEAATGELLQMSEAFTVPSKYEDWAVLMLVPQEVFLDDGRKRGHYSGTFELIVTRHEQLAAVPLTVGLGYVDGPRSVRIVNAAYRVNHCAVDVAVTNVSTWASSLSQPRLGQHFRRRDGLPLSERQDFHYNVMSMPMGMSTIQQTGGGGIGSVSFGVPPVYMPRPFEILYLMFQPTYAVAPDVTKPIQPGPACDQIEMLVERTTYAGRLTRTLEISDFRMNDADEPSAH
jgi:hypothetical protein